MQSTTEPRRTRLNPDARSRQLMDHAIAVFAQRGIGRASHAEIAERAHVSVATVFNYFHTREELVDAVLAEVETHLYTLVQQAYDSEHGALASVERFIERYINAAYEKGEYNLIALEWSATIREDVLPRFHQFNQRVLDLITNKLQRSANAGELKLLMAANELARLLNSLCLPVCQQIFSQPQPPKEEIKSFMMRASRLALAVA